MSKQAILLLNLGSPKSCEVGDVRDYLREFLGDERVLDGNVLLRWVRLQVILSRRPPHSAAAYRRVWTPEGAPLLVFTERLRAALEAALPEGKRVFVGMRYGKPSTREAVAALAQAGAKEVVVLPQYPHFAMSSYETAVERAREELARQLPQARVVVQEPFYNAPGYIEALAESARPFLEESFDALLFSYHGIPLHHLRREIADYPDCHEPVDCCPPNASARARDYRHQCFATRDAFVAAAGIPLEKCLLSFQSRLGRAVWIRPHTDDTLRSLPARGVKKLLVICPAFTADCLETLDEIQNEGRRLFLEAGGEKFTQIPCLNDHPAYTRFLASEVSRLSASFNA
ncbi:MAG: ferrochelatase [Puniceicoccales bacterium]|jgi:ferrochelatase|nr:ferrochelatase [Puniceicoccales bacterium]